MESRRVGLPDPVLGAPDIGLAAFGSRVEQATGQVADMLQRVAAGTANEQRNADVMKFGRESNDQVLQFYRDMPNMTSEEVEPAFLKLRERHRQTLGKIKDPEVRDRVERHSLVLFQTLGRNVARDKTGKAVRASQSEGILAEQQLVEAILNGAEDAVAKAFFGQAADHLQAGLGTRFDSQTEVDSAILALKVSQTKAYRERMGAVIASASQSLSTNPSDPASSETLHSVASALSARVLDGTYSRDEANVLLHNLKNTHQLQLAESIISRNPEDALGKIPKMSALSSGEKGSLLRKARTAKDYLPPADTPEQRKALNAIALHGSKILERIQKSPLRTPGDYKRAESQYLRQMSMIKHLFPDNAVIRERAQDAWTSEFQDAVESQVIQLLGEDPSQISYEQAQSLARSGAIGAVFFDTRFASVKRRNDLIQEKAAFEFQGSMHNYKHGKRIPKREHLDAIAASEHARLVDAENEKEDPRTRKTPSQILVEVDRMFPSNTPSMVVDAVVVAMRSGDSKRIGAAVGLYNSLKPFTQNTITGEGKLTEGEAAWVVGAMTQIGAGGAGGGNPDWAASLKNYLTPGRDKDSKVTAAQVKGVKERIPGLSSDDVGIAPGTNLNLAIRHRLIALQGKGFSPTNAADRTLVWLNRNYGIDDWGIPQYRKNPPQLYNQGSITGAELRAEFAQKLYEDMQEGIFQIPGGFKFAEEKIGGRTTGMGTQEERRVAQISAWLKNHAYLSRGPEDDVSIGQPTYLVEIRDADDRLSFLKYRYPGAPTTETGVSETTPYKVNTSYIDSEKKKDDDARAERRAAAQTALAEFQAWYAKFGSLANPVEYSIHKLNLYGLGN